MNQAPQVLDRAVALGIVNALRSGTVPPEGLEHFAVGLDAPMKALSEQRAYVKQGKSAYKFIRGSYGSGKTFLTSLAGAQALQDGFLTSKVVISVADTPLYRLSEVYRRLCQNLTLPGRRGGALQSLLDRWLYSLEEQVIEVDGVDENAPEFEAAVGQKVEQHLVAVGQRAGRLAACLKAYHEAKFRQDFEEARGILDWMAGEAKVGAAIKRVAGVTGQIDNTDALVFLRGWLELVRAAGHAGILVILDEVETVLRLRRPERLKSLEVLRQLVDAQDHQEFPGLHLLITGTPDFFDSPQGVLELEPLHERIKVLKAHDQPENLRQPQIPLRPFDPGRLLLAAQRIRELYPADHPERLKSRVTDDVFEAMVERVTRGFGGRVEVVPRLFLREVVNLLDLVDQHESYAPIRDYSFDESAFKSLTLAPEEAEALSGAVREVVL
ncbi:BREX system ATP-binding protein BrxD [bacterium CPR1]|nr:BREX system ATP-binding protein BrxD [bacterium CPR1]